jgi:deoxyribodipyrimidine photo-lyase
MKALVWFRRDLRLQDNSALAEAMASGLPVEAVYIHGDHNDSRTAMGAASRWYLHHSVIELQKNLAGIGVPLRLFAGSAVDELPAFCAKRNISEVYWNRVVEPELEASDEQIIKMLSREGVIFRVFSDDCLIMPEHAYKADGGVYRVFTPFWRSLQKRLEIQPVQARLYPAPARSSGPICCSPTAVEALRLLPAHPWHQKLHHHWQPGESSAHRLLETFLEIKAVNYEVDRDFPAIDGTSKLSPALHFGEISVARVYERCNYAWVLESGEGYGSGIRRLLSEIGWREFARHVLHAFPHTAERSMNARFDQRKVWEPDPEGRSLHAWQQGETGISLVDAGMRELWETGWMHNRVRMIVGSFLTKNLGIHWREGARWFWDTLVDADLASNTLGWQWVAGCGTDAAPYFRVFNPDTQAKKFDPEGRYISRWLGNQMRPSPVVDLKASRARALVRYQRFVRQTAA